MRSLTIARIVVIGLTCQLCDRQQLAASIPDSTHVPGSSRPKQGFRTSAMQIMKMPFYQNHGNSAYQVERRDVFGMFGFTPTLFFYHQMKAVCHVKHLGVDKKLLKTLLPPSCQCPAHLNTFVFRVIVHQAARVTEMANAPRNSIPNNNALRKRQVHFFRVMLDPSEIVLYVICFCCWTTTA